MEDDITPEEVAEMFEQLIELGYISIIGYDSNDEPLYKFSPEMMDIPEFYEVHEAITNDILFRVWNKGFIEMNPLNEEGDWNVRLNDKSHSHDLAYEELDEDEYVLFIQIFDELKNTEV